MGDWLGRTVIGGLGGGDMVGRAVVGTGVGLGEIVGPD